MHTYSVLVTALRVIAAVMMDLVTGKHCACYISALTVIRIGG